MTPKKVFISYSHDSDEHSKKVRGLADSLRRDGVDCQIDQYLPQGPESGWTTWMEDTIEWADFVLMICTETYHRRVRKKAKEGEGLGVTWEAGLIHQHLYESQGRNSKFLPVVFESSDEAHIPTIIRGGARYVLDLQKAYDHLYSILTKQAKGAPPLGQPKTVEKEKPEPLFAPAGGTARGTARPDLQDRYLREVRRQCGHLAMSNIDPKATQASGQLALERIFTQLDTRKFKDMRAEGEEPDEQVERQSKRHLEDDQENREPVLARVTRHPKLVLLGDPGSGKSTLVNYICLCLANELLGQDQVNLAQLKEKGWLLEAHLPVRVILRDYAARGLPDDKPLWAFLVDELSTVVTDGNNLGDYTAALRQHLTHEGGILLLDGLDEVPEAHERRANLRKAIADFEDDFPKVRILVTTRPYAYDDPKWQLPGFQSARLLDFSPEQIQTYIGLWYEVTGNSDPDLGPKTAATYADQLKAEVERNKNLAELGARPLLLALMVSLHRWRGGGALPQERERLYDQSVDLLLDMWQRPKEIRNERGEKIGDELSALRELGIGPKQLRDALSEVAFEVHRDQPSLSGTADIEGKKLAAALFEASEGNVPLDRIIRYTKDRAGVLQDRGPDPRGRATYAFAHRTFQEYLAACHLLDKDPEQLIDIAKRDPERWRETLLLAGSRANQSPLAVWGIVDGLCYKLAPRREAEVHADDWWGAFLAGAVLVETKRFKNPARKYQQKLDNVRQWLCSLVTRGALSATHRAEAGQFLGQLGDPREEVLTVESMEFCYVPAGPFYEGEPFEATLNEALDYEYWISQYPISNAQYSQFVSDEGYLKQRYWSEAIKANYWSPEGFKGRWDDEPSRGPYRFRFPFDVPNHPVGGVSWYEAIAFTVWLTQKLKPEKGEFRLPHGTEWVKAARGGLEIPERCGGDRPGARSKAKLIENQRQKQDYPWGDTFDPEKANCSETGIGSTSAVGSFPAGQSPYGCLEMSGNVYEWTLEETGDYRVIRGGSFDYPAVVARVSYRDWADPDNRFTDLGFRVVLAAADH